MNANQIHVGHEYAIAPYSKPNGNQFIPGAIRFVAYRTFGEQEPGNIRLTMFVEGFRLDREAGTPLSTNYVKFRVRDVIDDWEEYQDRADQYEVEQEKIRKEQEERWRLDRERRERERLELETRLQREREQLQRQREERQRKLNTVLRGLEDRGLDLTYVHHVDGTDNVSITIDELHRWLQTLTRVECETCHRDLIMIPKGLVPSGQQTT